MQTIWVHGKDCNCNSCTELVEPTDTDNKNYIVYDTGDLFKDFHMPEPKTTIPFTDQNGVLYRIRRME